MKATSEPTPGSASEAEGGVKTEYAYFEGQYVPMHEATISIHTHALCCLLLRESKTAHRACDLDCQTGFDLQFLSIGKLKISKHITGATLYFDLSILRRGHF